MWFQTSMSEARNTLSSEKSPTTERKVSFQSDAAGNERMSVQYDKQ